MSNNAGDREIGSKRKEKRIRFRKGRPEVWNPTVGTDKTTVIPEDIERAKGAAVGLQELASVSASNGPGNGPSGGPSGGPDGGSGNGPGGGMGGGGLPLDHPDFGLTSFAALSEQSARDALACARAFDAGEVTNPRRASMKETLEDIETFGMASERFIGEAPGAGGQERELLRLAQQVTKEAEELKFLFENREPPLTQQAERLVAAAEEYTDAAMDNGTNEKVTLAQTEMSEENLQTVRGALVEGAPISSPTNKALTDVVTIWADCAESVARSIQRRDTDRGEDPYVQAAAEDLADAAWDLRLMEIKVASEEVFGSGSALFPNGKEPDLSLVGELKTRIGETNRLVGRLRAAVETRDLGRGRDLIQPVLGDPGAPPRTDLGPGGWREERIRDGGPWA